MPKNPDCMEMPCLCDCGEWFDLLEGFPSKEDDRKVICENCYQDELKPPKGKKKEDLRKDDIKWFQTDNYYSYTKPHGYYQNRFGKASALCDITKYIDLGNDEMASIHEIEENSEPKYACKKCQAIFNKMPW